MSVTSREPDAATLAQADAADPAPSRCGTHSCEAANWKTCDVCDTFHRWARRRQSWLRRRGLRFSLPAHRVREYAPKPPPCPDHKPKSKGQRHSGPCEPCRAVSRWNLRLHTRAYRAEGKRRTTTDLAELREHIEKLSQGGMVGIDISRASGVSDRTVLSIRRGESAKVFTRVRDAIMAIPVPDPLRIPLVRNVYGSPKRFVDATGTARRIGAARRAGYSFKEQAARLGWSLSTLRFWSLAEVVSVDAADAVAHLYPQLIANPITNKRVQARATSEGVFPARYFTAENIDDPSYNPVAIDATPRGLRRRLQALAWHGHGPEELAPEIGEPVEKLREWMMGAPAPAYVLHLVKPVYEKLSFSLGGNQAVADLARDLGWAPPLAWDDLNMDHPSTKPRIDMPPNSGMTKQVLPSVVFDAIDGVITAGELLHDEKVSVVWTLHRRGWSDRRIAAWLRWHEDIEKGEKNVCKFREREKIVGFGIAGHGLSTADVGLIIWGAAA